MQYPELSFLNAPQNSVNQTTGLVNCQIYIWLEKGSVQCGGKKTNNTNNKNNIKTNISENPKYENVKGYKIKPKILKPRICLEEKITSVDTVDSIEELDDKKKQNQI